MNPVKRIWFLSMLILMGLPAGVFCAEQKDSNTASPNGYVYDEHGKKDPMVPVVDTEGRVLLLLQDNANEDQGGINITIQGIIYNGEDSKVLIDNRLFRQGDKLGQLEIKKIYKDFIIIFDGKQEYQIKVK